MGDKLVQLSDIQNRCHFTQDERGEWILAADIIKLPTVEVRHGRWEGDYPLAKFRLKRCSACGTLAPEGWYCFLCGACMDGEV